MSISTYAELNAAVADWTARTDLTSVIQDFVMLAEGDMNRVLRGRQQITVTSLTPDANSQVTLPSDYLEFRTVTALTTPRRVLSHVSPGNRDDAYPYRDSGYPSVFSVDGTTMLILPATTSSISLEYFAKVPALSASNTTNWVLTKAPDVYLYGSLRHAAVYLKDGDSAIGYDLLFNKALNELARDERAAVWSRGGARIAGVTP